MPSGPAALPWCLGSSGGDGSLEYIYLLTGSLQKKNLLLLLQFTSWLWCEAPGLIILIFKANDLNVHSINSK